MPQSADAIDGHQGGATARRASAGARHGIGMGARPRVDEFFVI
ncbi:hypothetical protein [Parafrankia sp. FMc2]